MIEGRDADDMWRMVEDEMTSIAHTFTQVCDTRNLIHGLEILLHVFVLLTEICCSIYITKNMSARNTLQEPETPVQLTLFQDQSQA